MRRLSDFKDEAAIDLWADIIDVASEIIQDEEIRDVARDEKQSNLSLAKTLLKKHKKEISQILLLIDDTPINGMNILIRLLALIDEIGEHPEVADFFGMQGQTEQSESSGSATENTEEAKK